MRSYEGLTGSAFLDRLQASEPSLLELIWRVADDRVCALVAPRMAKAEVKQLAGLLAAEALSPQLGAATAAASMEAVRECLPQLPAGVASELAERLASGDDLGLYEPYRDVLEAWTIAQTHKVGFQFSTAVLRLETLQSSSSALRQSAMERVLATPKEAGSACSELTEALLAGSSSILWAVAAELAGAADSVLEDADASLNRLLEELLCQAPSQCPEDTLSEELADAIRSRAGAALMESLRDTLPDTPGALSVVRTSEEFSKRSDRLRFFRVAVVKQVDVWRGHHGTLVSEWDAGEWTARLKELQAVRDDVDSVVLDRILSAAPATASALVVRLVVTREEASDEELRTAATKVAEHVHSILDGADDSEALEEAMDAVWWPPRNRPLECERVRTVLLLELDDALAAKLVAGALKAGRLDAERASALLPASGSVLTALRSLGRCEERMGLVGVLLMKRPDETLEAARVLQSETLCLDITQAVAPVDSTTAFLGIEGAYASLDAEDRALLLELLEVYGGPNQASTLCDYIQDTRGVNAGLRERATKKVGEVTEAGGALPECVVKLLASNTPALRKVATTVIGEVKPRDAASVTELRNLAGKGNVPGDLAQATLDLLAADYALELSACQDKGRIVLLLDLLGLTGSPGTLPVLLRYVGEMALDDHETVRRAAANAVETVCSTPGLMLTTQELDELVEAAEGNGREVDAEASESLMRAVARARLGDDAALGLLFEKADYRPTSDPSVLFGDQKANLLEHLSLYEREVPRGEAGWPNRIVQLDLIAERLANTAYLAIGKSESLIDKIRNKAPGAYGQVIGAMKNLKGFGDAEPHLRVLHKLRSDKTQVPHVGVAPTDADVTTAEQVFRNAAGLILEKLDDAMNGRVREADGA
jgi:hypothetical protein